MVDVHLQFESQEEFEEFIKGLNNATISYKCIISSVVLGLEIPHMFEKLTTVPEESLDSQFKLLRETVKKLDNINENIKEDQKK